MTLLEMVIPSPCYYTPLNTNTLGESSRNHPCPLNPILNQGDGFRAPKDP